MKAKYFIFIIAILCLSLLSYSISQAHSVSSFSKQKIISLANQDRGEFGIPALSENENLDLAARLKLDDMVQNSYFAHSSPTGKTPWYFLHRASYNYKFAGENLAMNFSSPENLEMAWMESVEHRANIMNPKFTQIGVAQKQVLYKGQITDFIVEYLAAPQK